MQTKSFTIAQNKGLLTKIMTEAVVFNPYNKKSVKVKTLWDTGATCSVISKVIANKISLKKICYSEMRHANGTVRAFLQSYTRIWFYNRNGYNSKKRLCHNGKRRKHEIFF
jgi:hypothetical protein